MTLEPRPYQRAGQLCSICRKVLADDAFGIITGTGKRRRACNACRAAAARAKRKQCPAQVRAAAREYRASHIAEIREQDRQQYRRNPVPAKARQKEYRLLNPEKARESVRRCYEKFGEKYRLSFQKWIKENREKWLAQQENYRKNNRPILRERSKKWRLLNPDKLLAQASKKRAIKKGAAIGDQVVVARFYDYVQTAPRIKCYWCKRWTKPGHRHVDHIFPISGGGPHVIWNLCCSCIACNQRKHCTRPENFSGQHEISFTLSGGVA